MTSIRVPPDLLERLHQAAPPGVSLAGLIDHLLKEAGDAETVRRRLSQQRRRDAAKIQVTRLRNRGHRSVILRPDEQLALADAANRWVRLLEARGLRHMAPQRRMLEIRQGGSRGATGTQKVVRWTRRGANP